MAAVTKDQIIDALVEHFDYELVEDTALSGGRFGVDQVTVSGLSAQQLWEILNDEIKEMVND